MSFFSDAEGLEKLIAEKKPDLMYSDIYFDDRIANWGLNQVNLKNFYVGYEGALRTVQELTDLCEMTFYRRYFAYFDR